MARRHYSATAQPVTLTSGITNADLTIPVGSTAGFPTAPFTIAIERGTVNEEVCLVTAIADGTHFTIGPDANGNPGRGYDGTAAVSHDSGKPVEHAVSAIDYEEANFFLNNLALFSMPIGVVLPYAGSESSVPANWLICDGHAANRGDYAALHALLRDTQTGDTSATSYPFGAGDSASTFNLPDLRGRFPLGKDTMGGTAANRTHANTAAHTGFSAGEDTHVLTTSEMPVHTHVQNSHSHTPANPATDFVSIYRGSDPSGGNGGITVTVGGAHATTTAATTATNQNAGSGTAHNIMSPYVTLLYIIKAL